jgi:uncharacterized repeat protein (TIGR01451 family)
LAAPDTISGLLRDENFSTLQLYETRVLYFAGMNVFFKRHYYLAVLLLVWLMTGLKADAQGFGISVPNPPAPVAINGTLIYTYSVTNLSTNTLPDFAVSNTFSANVNFLSASNSYPTNNYVVGTNGNVLVYVFSVFTNSDVVTFSLAVQPVSAGLLTNTIQVTAVNLFTNTATTNIVTLIYSATSDLGVAVTGPSQAVITNDITSYSVFVTNSGPQDAPGVLLTNTLPPGVILKGVSPSSPGFSLSGSNMIFSLGTLASGSGKSFTVTIQATNVETATLSASIGAPSVLDTNTANNFASTNISFIGYLPGVLIAFTNSIQTVNLQNGSLEQSIVVSNAGTTNVPAVRVVVTGLTNELFNAVGTNNGSPFVYLSAPLAVGQAATLRLQYIPRNSFPFTNGQLHAFAVPLPNWTPSGFGISTSTSTNINIRRIIMLPNGEVLLEFPTTAGKTYTIIYSGDMTFSNAIIAPPAIVAPANAVQWDDYGPPATTNFPSASSMRFYRVYQNP